MKSIHTSLPERERHTVYTALFCYVLELQLLDGSAYNKELLAQAGRKNGHSPSAQLTNLEKKKGSQSTRKRRVACPFHLVYQATYRYIMQPPTRVISLDSALLCSANGRYQHSTFLSIFKVAHQIIVLSLSSCYKFCFALLTSPDPHQNERSNRFFHIYFVQPPIYYILSSVQDRVNIPLSILNGHPSEIKSMAVYIRLFQ